MFWQVSAAIKRVGSLSVVIPVSVFIACFVFPRHFIDFNVFTEILDERKQGKLSTLTKIFWRQ